MQVLETAVFAADRARRIKELVVRKAKPSREPGAFDILTIIENYRGNDLVSMVHLSPDRDDMLEAANVCAFGFEADMMTLTFETWQSTKECADGNPLTGQPWGAGELGDAALKHDGIAKGWVSEAIVVLATNRAGDVGNVSDRYRRDGREVVWDERLCDTEAMSGPVVEALVSMMNAVTITANPLGQMIEAEFSDLSPERRRAHIDIAATRILGERVEDAVVMLTAKPGSVREQIIRERFPRSQVVKLGSDGQPRGR